MAYAPAMPPIFHHARQLFFYHFDYYFDFRYAAPMLRHCSPACLMLSAATRRQYAKTRSDDALCAAPAAPARRHYSLYCRCYFLQLPIRRRHV